MKKIHKTLLHTSIALTACALLLGSAQAATTTPTEKAPKTSAKAQATPASSNSFTESPAWSKVGTNLQQAYLAAEKTGFSGKERLTCFVKANENIMDGDQSFLTSNGFVVQMVSGFTARGQMELKNLPAVAGLPFVQRIDTAN